MKNLGLKGDRKGRKDSKRQVNLLSVEWLNQKQAEGYQIGPGQFGEQLVINGLAVESLQPGDMLELGETACLEITKPRIGCDRLEAAQGKNKLADTEVGMLARVIQSGLIQVGDEVCLRPRASLNPL